MKNRFLTLVALICAFAATAYCQAPQSSTDRAIINVKGNVKSVTENEDGFFERVYTFDATGKMTNYESTKLTAANSKRDSQGRLISVVTRGMNEFEEEYDVTTRFSYNAQGRLAKIKVEEIYGSWSEVYRYDAKGQLVSMEVTEAVENIKYKYRFVSFDAKGNWTKMIRTDFFNSKATFTRKITYY